MKKILLLSLLFATTAGYAQDFNPAVRFPKGAKLTINSEVKSTSVVEAMGQTMETLMSVTMLRAVDVENVSDNGTAKLEVKNKRVKVTMESPMGGNMSVDSDNDADMKGEAGKELEKLLKNKYSVEIDGTGKIVTVKADDDNPIGKGVDAEAASSMIASVTAGFGSGATELPKVGLQFELAPFAKASPQGQSWTVTTDGRSTTYTYKEATPTDYVIGFTSTGTTNKKQEAMGMEMTMKTTDTGTGTIKVDRKTGIVREQKAQIKSEGNMEVMGSEVPITNTVNILTTVTGI